MTGWMRCATCDIRFEKQIVYIKAVLTHRDYDKGVWKS